MFYSEETGICEQVSYERYCEDIEERGEQIKQKEIEIENLKVELEEHKQVINEFKKLCEEIFKDERNDKLDKKQK